MTGRRKSGLRLGMTGYASILRRLMRKPMTAAEVCEAEIGCMNTARVVLRRMHVCRLVHVSGWKPRTVKCGGFAAVWSAGDAEDVPYPAGELKKVPAKRNNVSSAMVAFASLIRELREPSTKAELALATGLSEETVRKFIDHARSIRLVRIGGWHRAGHDGRQAAMWVLGSTADAPRPSVKSRQQIDRDNNQRRRERANFRRLQAAVTVFPFAQLEAA